MPTRKPYVSIVLPVYNEEVELKENTLRLYSFLKNQKPPFSWEIVIADNASTDHSGKIGRSLQKKYDTIFYVYIRKKGRGRAVKFAWKRRPADYFAYMDIDLSTDLGHFPSLIAALMNGYAIAIGSRLLPASNVSRRPIKREILSRCYNILIKLLFQTKFSDAQCGFKAVDRSIVARVLPNIKDNEWFFDSELLITSEKMGFKIYEEPVSWVDNPGSTVRVLKTVTGDLAGLLRLFFFHPWKGV